MFVSLQNADVEIRISKATVSALGALGRPLGHEGIALMYGLESS